MFWYTVRVPARLLISHSYRQPSPPATPFTRRYAAGVNDLTRSPTAPVGEEDAMSSAAVGGVVILLSVAQTSSRWHRSAE